MVLLTVLVILNAFPKSGPTDISVSISPFKSKDNKLSTNKSKITLSSFEDIGTSLDNYSNELTLLNIFHTHITYNITNGKMSWKRIILELMLKSYHSSIIHIHPSDENSFLDVLKVLSRCFNTLKDNYTVWKPTFVVYWPAVVEINSTVPSVEVEFRTIEYLSKNENNLSFPINSEVFIVLKGNQETVYLLEVYKYKSVSNLKLVTTFQSKRNSNIDEFEIDDYISNEPISTRRYNLSGIEISAVAQNDPDYQPRIQITTYPNGSSEFTGGMCLSILLELQSILGFSFKALDGKGWMGLFPNGTWTGMSSQVVNGEADISIAQASTIMMTDQLHGISFLHPTSYGTLVAIFRQPTQSSVKNIMTTAFEPYVWGCGFFIWIFVILGIRLIYRISLFNGTVQIRGRDKMFVEESTWWAISTICFMGWYLTPTFRPLRVTFAIGCFLASFLFVAYSASLMSLLSTQTVPIKNFVDLSISTINVLADKWLPMAHHVVQEIYNNRNELKKLTDDYYIQLESAIQQILKRQWAYVTFSDAISVVFHRLNYTDAFYCNEVHSVVVSLEAFSNAMFVKKGSPMRDIFNIKILTMTERGFTNRHNKLYDAQTQILCPVIFRKYRGDLSMKDLSTPFIVLTGGVLLSLGFLVIERLKNSKNIYNVDEKANNSP